MCGDQTSCNEILAWGVVLAAEPGPSGWRNADIAAIGCSERTCCATRLDRHVDSGNGPTLYGEAMDGGIQSSTGLRIQDSKCRSHAQVSSAESCVIEQHVDRLLKGVEPTNLGLCTPNAAALVVRIARRWANDMAMAPKECQDAGVVLPIDLEKPAEEPFDQRTGKRRGVLRSARHNGNPATRGSGSDATMAGLLTARREADGGVHEPRK